LSAVLGCSTFLMVTPSHTAATVDTFLIAVLPQAGQHHRSANEVADARQSQGFSGCSIGGTPYGSPIVSLVVGGNMLRPAVLSRRRGFDIRWGAIFRLAIGLPRQSAAGHGGRPNLLAGWGRVHSLPPPQD